MKNRIKELIEDDRIDTYKMEEEIIFSIIEAHGLAQVIYYMNEYLKKT